MPSRHKQRWGRAPLRSAPKPKALKDRIKTGGHPLFFNDLTGTVLARYPVHFYSAIDIEDISTASPALAVRPKSERKGRYTIDSGLGFFP